MKLERSMKAFWIMAALIAFSISTPSVAQTTPAQAGSYVIIQGVVGTSPVTILLDSVNGKTWFLGQVDDAGRTVPVGQGSAATATWIPLPFAAKAPISPPR